MGIKNHRNRVKHFVAPSKKKLSLTYMLNFYDAYVRDKNLNKVAAAMGTVPSGITDKVDRWPILKRVMEIADKNRAANSLKGYVTRQLSQEAKETWKELQEQAEGMEGIESIFAGKTRKIRQELFIYAMMTSGFNVSEAMRSVGINHDMMSGWREDLDFLQLLEEVHFHKKNFFENQLIGLVSEAHPGAVMFVNRTVNADRGYSEKLELAHSGEIKGGDGIKLEDLDLDLETRKKVLAAVRQLKESRAVEGAKQVSAAAAPKLIRRDNKRTEQHED
jgi:hypothetical protein